MKDYTVTVNIPDELAERVEALAKRHFCRFSPFPDSVLTCLFDMGGGKKIIEKELCNWERLADADDARLAESRKEAAP